MARPSTAFLKNSGSYVVFLAAVIAGSLLLGAADAEEGQTTPNPAQNFLVEHEIGHRFRIDPSDLPAPKTGPIGTCGVCPL